MPTQQRAVAEFEVPVIISVYIGIPVVRRSRWYKKMSSLSESCLPADNVHPYLLKEYRNRWYVIAYNEQKEDMRTYGLDRIVSLRASACNYNIGFAVGRDYLSDCIGINLEDQVVEDVVLKFIPSEGHYLKTQKMHHSQETVSDDQHGLVIKLRLIINFELIGIILGYGAKVTVISPAYLKKQIVKISNNIINNYPDLKLDQ